jgi:hypothetical protein
MATGSRLARNEKLEQTRRAVGALDGLSAGMPAFALVAALIPLGAMLFSTPPVAAGGGLAVVLATIAAWQLGKKRG